MLGMLSTLKGPRMGLSDVLLSELVARVLPRSIRTNDLYALTLRIIIRHSISQTA